MVLLCMRGRHLPSARPVLRQGEEAKAVEPVKKSVSKDVTDWAVQNDNQPLWTRSPREVGSLPPET